MKFKFKRSAAISAVLIVLFAVWTFLIKTVDVKPAGVNATYIGFSTINVCFHSLTGVDMALYNITDWLGLVLVFICMIFAAIGAIQLVKRKSIFKVDADIIILGVYYVLVILCYLLFEMIPLNYRPVLINGVAESSYPSSTTLLVLSVMPTPVFQLYLRSKNKTAQRIAFIVALLFSLFMVLGRLVSGVHWLTDIIGSVLLSAGLFYAYKAVCFRLLKNKEI